MDKRTHDFCFKGKILLENLQKFYSRKRRCQEKTLEYIQTYTFYTHYIPTTSCHIMILYTVRLRVCSIYQS